MSPGTQTNPAAPTPRRPSATSPGPALTRALDAYCDGRSDCTKLLEFYRLGLRECVRGELDSTPLVLDLGGMGLPILDDVNGPGWSPAIEGPLLTRLSAELARVCLAHVPDLDAKDRASLLRHLEDGRDLGDWAETCARARCDDELTALVRALPEVP